MTDKEKLNILNDLGIIIVSAIRMNRDRHSNHLPYRQVLNLEILQEMRIMSAAVYCTWRS